MKFVYVLRIAGENDESPLHIFTEVHDTHESAVVSLRHFCNGQLDNDNLAAIESDNADDFIIPLEKCGYTFEIEFFEIVNLLAAKEA